MSELDALNAVLSAPAESTTSTQPQSQAQPAAETSPDKDSASTNPPVETQQTPPATEPKAAETKSDAPAQPEAETEETPEQIFTGTRQNQAFAQMRVQNKQLQDTIGKLGQIMGLPGNTPPDQLIPIVQQRLLEIEAKANNIPVELAQRLEQAEQQRQQQESEMLKNNAALAFQKVKDTYKLTQNQLIEFAQKLNESGKNPYQQPLDLMQEYRLLNFDALLEKARTEAAQEVLVRQQKAATQSSAPSKANGQTTEPLTKVSSINDLNKLLGGQ
ncbi:MAG: hypothetical protein GX173_02905 [Ruminococcaceae bacterium]|nr:hypothetical protein [Oscillospiraceae bacterium]